MWILVPRVLMWQLTVYVAGFLSSKVANNNCASSDHHQTTNVTVKETWENAKITGLHHLCFCFWWLLISFSEQTLISFAILNKTRPLKS